ncbi:hypothetical protein EG344_19550 [Chryseobacterium sp. G0162]|nr:hypothetical protein EG344_19550 [Chryseobacterium sp. G0162]
MKKLFTTFLLINLKKHFIMDTISKTMSLKGVTENLDIILKKRNGGAVNFRGVHYQILYACYLILLKLNKNSTTKYIQLEGIEDIDIHTSQAISTDSEYIQLKSSVNKMNAGAFWELGVLQNFLEVFAKNPESRFKLVYNMKIADGNLSAFMERKHGENLSKYWIDKLISLSKTIDFNDFADRISFEQQTANELYSKILVLLFKEWNINKGTENQFLNSLFYNILIWSENRASINKNDINLLFQSIKDSFSKAPINKAILNNWISKISYEHTGKQSDEYYDGKAARPSHITQGLPVRRKSWEKKLETAIQVSDIVVVRSSSGQGKSTLAWQVGYNLKNHYSLYQLNACKDTDEANAVIEFLDSRILIGENPLVIIDGLNSLVTAWNIVAEKAVDMPIKFLITTRQEDWFRFGADISRINLTSIDISLSTNEAKDIFEQFKKKDKIHPDVKDWQPVWEQVMEKGLLIEYAFLLTKGQMIHDRLSSQIKLLNGSISSPAKIEILRMVSLADCLNIKLETSKLLAYIKSDIGFQQDRDLILQELEKEYFLNFNNHFIEGLHPVRSNHLKDLLHTNLYIGDSLINLLKIINEDYKYDFYINSPFLLLNGKVDFYNDLADYLAENDISDMVFALDGIMHGEPQRYWAANKQIFDDVYNTEGIEIFSMATVPFAKITLLNELSSILGEKGAIFEELEKYKSELPAYSFEKSDLVLFANSLKAKLAKRTLPISSYQGLEFLCKWYNELKIPLSLPFIQNTIHINDLLQLEIQEAKEFMLYLQLNNPSFFKDFINKNKSTIISYIKVNTNSLTIQEKDGDVYIHYLLFSNEADKANEFSVFRIQVFHAFLPIYEKYCTEAILLPFPSEGLISITRQNSIKNLTKEAIGNMFNAHLNKIWLSTIQKNYQESSAYEWQRNIIDIRQIAIEWAKDFIKLVDSLLEGNYKKKDKASASLDQLRAKLSDFLTKKKPYPKYENKYFELTNYKKEEQEIDEWFASLGNINGQMLNIFIPKVEHDRNIALINMKAVYLNLKIMQDAFRKIEAETIPYFDSENICLLENQYFERLYATVQYYLSQLPIESKNPVHVAKKEAEEWWHQAKTKNLSKLTQVLNKIEENTDYKFILPIALEETETLTYATFGIENFDFSDENSFFQLSMDLALLCELDIQFFSIISVKDNVAIGGIRFNNDYFKAFLKAKNGDYDIDQEKLTPLPIYLEQKVIITLPQISLSTLSVIDEEKENVAKILFEVWRLSEFRSRLDNNSEIEKIWLESTSFQSKNKIDSLMLSINVKDYSNFQGFVSSSLEKNIIYSTEEIVSKLIEYLKN